MKNFNYTSELSDGILFLAFSGEIVDDMSEQQDLDELMITTVKSGTLACCIDLSGVKYISSSGIGWLITQLTRFRNGGGELVLLNPSEHIQKLLIITKLNGIFEVFDSREKSIDFLKK